jgi:CMP-N-acetylneuraminic acid synthetase
MPKIVAMIPARMGSQRLKKKNLRELSGVPLITRAIRKCLEADCFSEVWVNSEDEAFRSIAEAEGVFFHHRPVELGNNESTSEQFVREFFLTRDCDYLLQVHSIAPLLTAEEVRNFTKSFVSSKKSVYLSCIEDQIEVAYKGKPVNFTFEEKTNSQELIPVQRITWSITGWKKKEFLKSFDKGLCATYSGEIGFYPVSPLSGHVIKTEMDLSIAEALMGVLKK